MAQAKQSDKWFYLTIIMAVAFLVSQGWTFYQTRLRTEKKIQKMRELIKRKKAQVEKQKELKEKKKKENEVKQKNRVFKQI